MLFRSHYSILELGEIIWKMFGDGREFKYQVRETVANTAHRREVDISKIKKLIGWEPKVTLEEGLKPTGEWIKRRREGGKKSLWA